MSFALSDIRRVLKASLPVSRLERLRAELERLQGRSIRAALCEQGLWELQKRLAHIVPDIRRQYSSFDLDTPYLRLKARGLHAFQMNLTAGAINLVSAPDEPLTIVDIGDSAGTHIQYLRELYRMRKLTCLSVNLDKDAVDRIQRKGLQALALRAEELVAHGISADLFISFEMVEHLESPLEFFKNLSNEKRCRALVITVPYLQKSRVGLHHIRNEWREVRTPEMTHIFELCPADWKLLFMHAGWKVEREGLYLQYPARGMFRLMKPIWRARDFEGFWGAVLVQDSSWSRLYRNGT